MVDSDDDEIPSFLDCKNKAVQQRREAARSRWKPPPPPSAWQSPPPPEFEKIRRQRTSSRLAKLRVRAETKQAIEAGMRWDPNRAKWIMPKELQMKSSEYVDKFNELVEAAKALGITAKPVSRFASLAKAEARTSALQQEIEKAGFRQQEGHGSNGSVNGNEKKVKKAKVANGDKPKTAKPKVEFDGTIGSLPAAVEVRDGTKKAKLLKELIDHIDQPQPVKALRRTIYGRDEESTGALMACLGGLSASFKKKGLPYEIKCEKDDKDENRYWLQAK